MKKCEQVTRPCIHSVRRLLAVLIATVLMSSAAMAFSPAYDATNRPVTREPVVDQRPSGGEGGTPASPVAIAAMMRAARRFEQSSGVDPYPWAPPCGSHNDRAFHTLWNADEGCHYDHHHGDNPHELDDLFGTSLFDSMQGEVSHPWQSYSDLGYENDRKHAGYFWHVRRDLSPDPGQVTYIRAFRLLVHQHPSGLDADVRFHSGVFEAVVADSETGEEGYIQIPGMWIDFGHLLVDGQRVIDVGMEAEPGRHKQHTSAGTPQIIWYGASKATHTPDRRGRIPRGFVSISTSVHDVWDYTSADDPSRTDDVACYGVPRCRANATLLRPHLIGVQVPRATWPVVDADGDGYANWTGFTDRYGVPVDGCGEASLDCVPVTLSGIRTTVPSYSCDQECSRSYRDHDIYFDRQTSGWSQPVP